MFFFMPNDGGFLCRVSRMSNAMLEEMLRNSKQIRTFEARVNNAIVHLFKIVPVSQMHINQLERGEETRRDSILFQGFRNEVFNLSIMHCIYRCCLE